MKHVVFMSDAELEEATVVGNANRDNAIRIGAKHKANLAIDDSRDRKRHILAAKSELACRIFLGKWARWNRHEHGKPDLEEFIDVKSIVAPHRRLIVPGDSLKQAWAYLLVYCEEPVFWLRGWYWGHEMSQRDDLGHPDRPPAYVVENHELHDPEWLRDYAISRRNRDEP